MLLSSGLALAAFAIWLVPAPPAERRARRLLAEELTCYRHHGHPPGTRRAQAMTYRININVPPGDDWVLLPLGQPVRSGLFPASRGKDKDLPGGLPPPPASCSAPRPTPSCLTATQVP